MADYPQHGPEMEGVEDEEVVFEGSAIYQHLLDVGYTDFEQSTYTPSTSQEKTQEDTSSSSHGKIGWLEAGYHRCMVFPHNLFGTASKLVQSYIYVSVANSVSRSKLVNEDDWLVLEHFLPEGEELQASACTTFPWQSILKYRDVAVIVVCLLLLCIAIEELIFQFCLLFAALIIYGLYCMYWVQKLTSLKKFVSSLKETNHLTSKTVRLLQEMDLIGKGFVLAQGPGASLASLYEEPPQISCLSEALLCTLTAVAKILLSAHTALVHRVPHYPVIKHLFDEQPVLEEGCTLTQRMQYLKSRVTVIKLQTSAVLTELLLWLHRSEEISEYNTVVDFISTLYKKDGLTDKTQSLRMQYEYNRCFWLTERPIITTSQSVEEKKKNVYLAIHSLGLHLQAALVRVQSLESKFEGESDTSKHCEPESLEVFPSYEYFKAQLTALRLELDSCQGCIEEAEVRAERKYGVADKSSVPEASLQDITEEDEHVELSCVSKPPTVLLYDQQVAPAEDEVFEAYINQGLADEERSELNDDLWCADARKERLRLRQQKEQGKRVLRELQPILTNRRRMWEEREKVALEKHGRKGKQSAVQIQESQEEEGQGKEDSTDDHCINGPVNIEQLNISGLRGTPLSLGSETPKHSIVPTFEAVVEDEVDSDEERLRVYRKIKQELDEDEEQRTASEERLRAVVSHFDENLKPFQRNIDRKKEPTIEYTDSASKEETVSALGPPLTSNKLFPSLLQHNCETFTDCMDEGIEERLENSTVRNINPNIGNKSTETKLLDSEVFSSGDEERATNSSCEEIAKLEEETFMHNEDIKDDESRKIDWTTFTLPTHQTDSLDDRLQLYSGSSCLGFQAEVAAKASAASKNFWMARKHPEETFGGMGEGEVFGTDSDEEKDSNSGDEN